MPRATPFCFLYTATPTAKVAVTRFLSCVSSSAGRCSTLRKNLEPSLFDHSFLLNFDKLFLFTMRCSFETQNSPSRTIETTSLRTVAPSSHPSRLPRNITISSPRSRRADLVSVLQEALDIIAGMEEYGSSVSEDVGHLSQ